LAFQLARFAALRFVPEFLFVIKLLFTGGEDKVGTAIRAF